MSKMDQMFTMCEEKSQGDAEIALLQLAEFHDEVQVDCDYCGAKALTSCRTKTTNQPTMMPHFGTRQKHKQWSSATRKGIDARRISDVIDRIKIDTGKAK